MHVCAVKVGGLWRLWRLWQLCGCGTEVEGELSEGW